MSDAVLKLLIDVGNSRVKYGLTDGQHIVATGMVDDMAQWLPLCERVNQVYLASVGQPEKVEQLRTLFSQQSIPVVEVVSQSQFGELKNAYLDAGKLGVDRWLAMLSCRHWYKGNFAVLDFGTAMTCDFVLASGQHLGGWIAPGFQTMHSALFAKTTLPHSTLPDLLDTTPARQTQGAIYNGCLAAMNGLIREAEYQLSLHEGEYRLYVTGGDARYLPIEQNPRVFAANEAVLFGLHLLASADFAE